MDYDFSKITPEQFEQLCYHLLSKIGFTNLEWYGKGGRDRGRDIVGTKTLEPLPGQRREEKWVVQCKRYIQARLQKSELSELFASAREHHPDSLLLITTAAISADLRDWITSIRSDHPFNIYLWDKQNLTNLINEHRSELYESFPALFPRGVPLFMYQLGPLEVHEFTCNDFDEISIRVINSDSFEHARQRVTEFIEHIRRHGVELDTEPFKAWRSGDSS
jgi:hypothetical protein